MPKTGHLTPSTFSDLMSRGKGSAEFGKTAMNVINQLALDLLGVERTESSTPASCQWGIEHEWEAIKEYEDRTFRTVHAPVEFKAADDLEYVGGTMDGLVGRVGGIEVKSPFNSMEHLRNLQDGAQFKTIYKWQLQGYFWIFGLEWIDGVSYDPRFPAPQDLAICRIHRDEEMIQELKERCRTAYQMAQGIALKGVDDPGG